MRLKQTSQHRRPSRVRRRPPATSIEPGSTTSFGRKKKTANSSYYEYLNYHEYNYPSLELLSSTTGDFENEPGIFTDKQAWGSACRPCWVGSVLNLSKGWDLLLDGPVRTDTGGADIIKALCHPPKDVQLQILLWNRCDSNDLHKDFLDFIGLCFEMDPRTMAALLNSAASRLFFIKRTIELASLCRNVVRIGSYTATVCKTHMSLAVDQLS